MGDIIISFIFIILSIFMLISSSKFTSGFNQESLGASGFPRMIAVLILILAVVNIIKWLKNNKKSYDFSLNKILDEYKNVILVLLMFLVYVVSMKYIGFIISTIIFLLSTQWILSNKSKRNIPIIVIITLFISLGAYFFFTSYLTVVFPAGIFFE